MSVVMFSGNDLLKIWTQAACQLRISKGVIDYDNAMIESGVGRSVIKEIPLLNDKGGIRIGLFEQGQPFNDQRMCAAVLKVVT